MVMGMEGMEEGYLEDVTGRLFSFPDKNNNTGVAKGEKYSLRPRSVRGSRKAGVEVEDVEEQVLVRPRGGGRGKEKARPAPLSKYRRKTANARERSRMREINAAFEALRRCVPGPQAAPAVPPHSEKLTKITTLRMAMQYISTLSDALTTQPPSATTTSACAWLTDPTELDLLLESDGESLPLSDHSLTPDVPDQCLTPVNLNMNFDQFTEPSLSPTFTEQDLSPFDTLFPDFS